jgi:hypothetical protein
MYFQYSRKTSHDYISFLLDNQFSPKKVLEQVALTISDASEIRDIDIEDDDSDNDTSIEIIPATQSKLSIKEVSDYAISVQDSCTHWFNTFFPSLNNCTTEEKKWLDCLNRIGMGYFRPLVMSSFANTSITASQRIVLFKKIERFIFIAFRLSQQRGNYKDSEFYNFSRDLYYGNISIDSIIKTLNDRMSFTFNEDGTFKPIAFQNFISNKFKDGSGFYGWSGIRYFLYEYEQYLFAQSKDQTQKIPWNIFVNTGDMVSIEHILPQTPNNKCWQDSFGQYNPKELSSLTNTLGNLLALSQPKNSRLQNNCYHDKRADKSTSHGYFNGSYSENLVAEKYEQWSAKTIKNRGLELLLFMENRWDIKLGDETTKLKLLNIDFLKED